MTTINGSTYRTLREPPFGSACDVCHFYYHGICDHPKYMPSFRCPGRKLNPDGWRMSFILIEAEEQDI